MQIKIDDCWKDLLVKAAADKEIIAHVRPGMSKLSPSAMVNAISYEFIRLWYEKKEGQVREK